LHNYRPDKGPSGIFHSRENTTEKKWTDKWDRPLGVMKDFKQEDMIQFILLKVSLTPGWRIDCRNAKLLKQQPKWDISIVVGKG
jgi:hypothetical protein